MNGMKNFAGHLYNFYTYASTKKEVDMWKKKFRDFCKGKGVKCSFKTVKGETKKYAIYTRVTK